MPSSANCWNARSISGLGRHVENTEIEPECGCGLLRLVPLGRGARVGRVQQQRHGSGLRHHLVQQLHPLRFERRRP
jgi:hypothetical protein